MKKCMLLLSLVVILAISGCVTKKVSKSQSTTERPYEIESLYEEMKQGPYVSSDYPNPIMYAIFFEVNRDGVLRALVTDDENRDRFSYWWHDYRFIDGRWQQGPIKKADEWTTDRSNYVEARLNEFYIMTEKGREPKLIAMVLVGVVDSHDIPGWDGERVIWSTYCANRITIDEEGYFKRISMPELDIRHDANGNPYLVNPKTPNYKLEPVQVQTFNPKDYVQKK